MNMNTILQVGFALLVASTGSFAAAQILQNDGPSTQWSVPGGYKGKAFPVVTPTTTAPANAVSYVNMNGDGSNPVWVSGYRSAGYLAMLHPLPNSALVSYTPSNHEISYPTAWGRENDGQVPGEPGFAFGSRLPINLLSQPNPGDFLDPAPTIGTSSLALVPNVIGDRPTAWNGLGRPTVHDRVDAITGLPLAKVTDLELPFGGATFRLIRTRSFERPTSLTSSISNSIADNWWDWVGLGWMASENPVLMVDTQVSSISPMQAESVQDVANNTGAGPVRVTRLILDAHRSIPFQFIYSNGEYETAPRFRAKLTHNGNWTDDTSNPEMTVKRWNPHPTWFKVSLYDGAVTYTFVSITRQQESGQQFYDPILHAEDVPPNRYDVGWSQNSTRNYVLKASSYADAPIYKAVDDPFEAGWTNPTNNFRNPGFGLPTLALCTRIEDQYGHAAIIHYAPVRQFDMGPVSSEEPNDGLHSVFQETMRRGQISHVLLKSGCNTPNAKVDWTLVYAHRMFAERGGWLTAARAFDGGTYSTWLNNQSSFQNFRQQLESYSGSLAIDAIYVVSGDQTQTLAGRVITVDDRDSYKVGSAPTLQDVSETDPLQRYNSRNGGASPLVLNWKHKVRYFYRFDNRTQTLVANETYSDNEDYGRPIGAPILIKTLTTSRQSAESARDLTSQKVFQYEDISMNPRFRMSENGVNEIRLWGSGVLDQTGGRINDYLLDWSERGVTNQPQRAGQWLPQSGAASTICIPWLSRIFVDEDLAKLGSEQRLSSGETRVIGAGVSVDDLATRWRSLNEPLSKIDDCNVLASVEWKPHYSGSSSWNFSAPSASAPAADDLLDAEFLPEIVVTGADAMGISPDNSPRLVSSLTVRSGSESTSTRINRVVVRPQRSDGTWSNQDHGWSSGFVDGASMHSSAFVLPYNWSAYPHVTHENNASISTTNPAVLVPPSDRIRWVVVADEFASETERDSGVNYEENTARKDGQVSRRVLTLNPSGVIMRDRNWNFQTGETSTTGDGLGKSYSYKKLHEWAADTGETLGSDLPRPVTRQLILMQERSIGWSSITSPTEGATNGLVTHFEYQWFPQTPTSKFPWSSALQLKAVAIQKGTVGGDTRRYVKQMFRDSERPFDVTAQIEFLVPRQNLETSAPLAPSQPDGCSVTYNITDKANDYASSPGNKWLERVTQSKVILPPRPVAGSSVVLYPVMMQTFDQSGNTPWSGSGLVTDPLNIGASSTLLGASFTMQYSEYEQGRVSKIVEDAVPGTVTKSFTGGPTVSVDVPTPLQGWQRVSPSGDDTGPLQRLTYYQYNDPRGNLSDIWFPNGRRWAKRVYQHNGIADLPVTEEFTDTRKQKHTETFVFSDAYWDTTRNGWSCLSPFQWELKVVKPVSTRFASFGEGGLSGTMRGNVEEPAVAQRKLSLDGVIQLDNPVIAYTIFPNVPSDVATRVMTRSLAEKKRILNDRGQVIETSLAELNINGEVVPVGSRETNNLVDMRRDRDIDGTIHRETRDFFGHWLRRYRGTGDMAWDHNNIGNYDVLSNNLILTERQEWGKGVNDAWLPTVHRRYDSSPNVLVFRQPYAQITPSQDLYGYPTVTQYDWRMRPVRVDSYDKGVYNPTGDPPVTPARLSTSLTYLDFQSRPVLEVSFGANTQSSELSLPSTLNPVTFDHQPTIPDPSEFFNCGIRPLSITQHIYAKDGTEYETRTYDVGWNSAGSVPYQSTITYRGLNNEVVYSQSPGQPVNIKIQHPAGHVLKSITVAPDANAATSDRYELSRTDFIHDPASLQVIDQISWERTFATGNALSSTNAVRTREFTWYDPRGRVTATADLGTESATFTSTANPLTRPDVGPTLTQSGPDFNFTNVSSLANLSARVSSFFYDNEGNQIASRDPSGSITRTWYTGRGMVAKQTDAYGTPLARTKTYEYRWNRLVGIKFQSAAGQAPTHFQETRSHYAHTQTITPPEPDPSYTVTVAAPVVDHDFNQISANASLVAKVWFPHRENGSYNLAQGQFYPANIASDLSFKYNIMGQIAERLDARGVVFRYTYDAQARLSRIDVGHYDGSTYVAGYPPEMNCATGIPADRIQRVIFTYDERGNQSAVTAHGPPSLPNFPDGIIITHNVAAYSNRDDLIKEWQSYGATAATSGSNESPNTAYEWAYAANGETPTAPSFNRLTKMTYPMPTGGVVPIGGSGPPRREVNFAYGSSTASSPASLGWLDHRFSRITQMTSGLTGSTAVTDISGFEYSGTSRRMTHTMAGGKIARTSRAATTTTAGLDHLDQFGRAKVFAFNATNGPLSGTALYRAEYTYDSAGNRIDANITERNAAQAEVANQNSVRSSYDDLQRLKSTDHGVIGGGGAFTSYRKDAWSLDLLGNWIGSSTQAEGRLITNPSNASAVLGSVDVAINQRNEPSTSTIKGESSGGGTTPLASIIRHDISGNLVFDGQFYYQYDAWNRLIQINKATIASGNVNPESMAPTPGPSPCPAQEYAIGPMVKHFTYDGVGRLIRVQSPFPTPEASTGAVRSERFYYDGARRVQEVVTDPLATVGLAGDPEGEANNPGLGEQLNNTVPGGQQQTGDPEGAPLSFESSQMQSQQSNPQTLVTVGGDPMPATVGGAEREYIWGPGDGPAGIYEILVQFDMSRSPWWMLQDASGDLVAMCDVGGSGVGGSARVVHSYQFDAYGQCLRANQLVANAGSFVVPYTRLGHKGLFLDRIDVGVASGNSNSGFVDNPRVVGGGYGSGGTLANQTGSIVRYFVNNRTYTPEYAIWNQRDPKSSGQRVFDGLVFHGVPIISMELESDVLDLYGDGGSLRQYCESRPGMGFDPDGLEFSLAFQMATMADGAWSDAEGKLDEAMSGLKTFLGLFAMLQNHRVYQEVDADWATDWSIDDEGSTHSQSFQLGVGVWADDETSLAFQSEASGGPAMASGIRLGPSQSRANYNTKKSQWSNIRRSYWKDMVSVHGEDFLRREMGLSQADIEGMRKGKSPEGWVVHHRRPLAHGGTNSRGNLYPMRRSTHQGDFTKLHKPPYPIPVDTEKFRLPKRKK